MPTGKKSAGGPIRSQCGYRQTKDERICELEAMLHGANIKLGEVIQDFTPRVAALETQQKIC
jgi:hypothetical protein